MPPSSSLGVVNPLTAYQFAVKFYAADSFELKPRDFIPIFHQWIQTHRLEDEVMIDVADYSHVHHGPGVLLVCHGGQYSLDQTDGRIGLLYTRKRKLEGDVPSRLRQAFGAALNACRLLEAEPALERKLRFGYEEALFAVQNRLLAPRTAEAFEAVKDGLKPFLGELYPEAERIRVEASGEPKDPLSVRIEISSESKGAKVGELVSRLGY